MHETLIDQGLNLMLFGMGTVFVFLTILVFATTLMSKTVARFVNDQKPSSGDLQPTSTTDPTDPKILAAIQKAIAAHRQR